MHDTHSKTIGYILWIFGFIGAHRFSYGRQITGVIWVFTLGLLYDLLTLNGQIDELNRAGA